MATYQQTTNTGIKPARSTNLPGSLTPSNMLSAYRSNVSSTQAPQGQVTPISYGRASAINTPIPNAAPATQLQATTTPTTPIAPIAPTIQGTPATTQTPTQAQITQPQPYTPLTGTTQEQMQQAYQQYYQNKPQMPNIDLQAGVTRIEDIYKNLGEAQTARTQLATQQGVANLEQQRAKALPEYEAQKGQVEVQASQGQRRIAEQLAAQGLGASGQAVSRNVTLESGRVKALADINTQKSQFINDVDFQINQLKQKGTTEETAGLKELEAQKAQALMQVEKGNQEMALQLYQIMSAEQKSNLDNALKGIEFNYKQEQDKIQQAFQEKQFTEQQRQQALDNAFREKQMAQSKAMEEANLKLAQEKFAYDKSVQERQLAQQAAASRAAAASKSSSASSKSSTASQKAYNDQYSSAVFSNANKEAQRTPGGGANYVRSNSENIISEVGSAVYKNILNDAIALDADAEKARTSSSTPATTTTTSSGGTGLIKSITNWFGNLFK